MKTTFYSVLGVGPDADKAEVASAFREQAKAHHPDVSDDDDASRTFKRLQTAREVLTDETERARYDRLGHDAYVRTYVDGSEWSTSTDEKTVNRTASSAASQYVDRGSTSRQEPTARAATRSQQTRGGTTAHGTAKDYYTPGQRVNPSHTQTTHWQWVTILRNVGPLLALHAVVMIAAIVMAGIIMTGGLGGPTSSFASLVLATSMIVITGFVSVMHVVSRLS